MFKLIVATSSTFSDYDLFRAKLDHLLQNQDEVEICSGFSLAGDALTDTYSGEREVTVNKFDPGFRGMYRALVYAEAALFFHDGISPGTAKYIEEARRCRLKVKVITFECVVKSDTPAKATADYRTPINELDTAIPVGKPRPRKPKAIIVKGEELIPKSKGPRKKKSVHAGDTTWKLRYQRAHEINFKKEYPFAHSGGHYLEPNYPKVRESNGLQTAIVNYLNWMGHRAKRINNMGRLVDGVDVTESGAKITAKKWIPSAAGRGQADISSTIWHGKSAQWEVKAGDDKPSEYQLKEQKKERRAGGIYEFIYSIEQFFIVYDQLDLSAQNNYQQAALFDS